MDSHERDVQDRTQLPGQLSRRGFLGAAATAGAAAGLGILGAGPAAARAGQPRAGGSRLLAAQGAKGDVGATVPEAAYGVADRLSAAKIFDSYVSPARGARVIQKYYFFNESEWPQAPLAQFEPDIPLMYDTSQGGAANFRWLVCFKPSRQLLPADQTALANACNLLLSSGIIFDVVLWQEPNTKKMTMDFSSGAEYVNYVNYYRPSVPAGIQVIYDCAGSATAADQVSYFPGSSAVNKIYMDFYGNHYASALAAGDDDPLATLNNLAISNGVPFGLGEWGFGLSAINALTPSTSPTAGQYVNYFTGVFTGRLNNGHRNGAIMYYNGTNAKSIWNIIPNPGDWRVPLYQGVYNALASPNG